MLNVNGRTVPARSPPRRIVELDAAKLAETRNACYSYESALRTLAPRKPACWDGSCRMSCGITSSQRPAVAALLTGNNLVRVRSAPQVRKRRAKIRCKRDDHHATPELGTSTYDVNRSWRRSRRQHCNPTSQKSANSVSLAGLLKTGDRASAAALPSLTCL